MGRRRHTGGRPGWSPAGGDSNHEQVPPQGWRGASAAARTDVPAVACTIAVRREHDVSPGTGVRRGSRESTLGTAFYDANVTEAAFFDLDKTVIAGNVLAFGPRLHKEECSTVGWSFGRCGARSCSATSAPTRAAW